MIIIEDFGCFSESDFVILFILARLLRIPFEDEHSYSRGNLTWIGYKAS